MHRTSFFFVLLWIILNQGTSTTAAKGDCADLWNIEITEEIAVRWNGTATDVANIEVNLTALHPSTCKSYVARLDFDDMEFLDDTVCSNTVYNVRASLICNEIVVELEEKVVRTLPSAPANVRVQNVTSTSYLVLWEAPIGTITKSEVEINGTVIKVDSGVTFLITHLQPETWYTVKVSSKGWSWSKWSEAVFVQTESLDPPILELGEITNSTIEVYWEDSKNGYLEYTVKWIEANSRSPQYNNTDRPWFEISGLTPYTLYDIQAQVLAGSEIGNWSDAIHIRTEVGVPFPPWNLREKEKSSRDVRVEWEEPTPSRGPILHYTISWVKLNVKRVVRSPEFQQTNETFLIVENLQPARMYTIQVSATTAAGEGKWSDPIEIKTLSEPPFPPRNVTAVTTTEDSIELLWVHPKAYTGKILGHIVRWSRLGSLTYHSANMTQFTYVIQPLEAFTNYSIQVLAWNDAGPGMWSEAVIVQTKVGVPAEPQNVKINSVTSTSLEVMWDEPKPDKGPLLYYTIKWKNQQMANITDTQYSIRDLLPLTKYKLQVRATSAAGTGNWTKAFDVWTAVGIPLPPHDIESLQITAASIELRWRVREDYKSYITQYTIRWWNEINSTLVNYKDIKGPAYYIMTNLQPFINYSIQIRSYTGAGAGNWSEIFTERTAVGVPSSPLDVKGGDVTDTSIKDTSIKDTSIKDVTDTSIKVMWKSPFPFVGPILKYTVKWTNMNTSQTEREETTKSPYLIKDLNPFTKYSISVKAETKAGPGNWSKPILIQTSIGVPLVPQNITALASNLSIELFWTEPEPLRGPILSYTVRWKNSGPLYINKDQTNNTYYVIKDLTPCTKFYIQISAMTYAGAGAWSEALEVETSIGIPSPPLNLKRSHTTDTSIRIIWESPFPFVGTILKYTLQWTNMNSNDIKFGETSSLNYLILDLVPFTNYSISVQAETSAGPGEWSEPVLLRTNIGIPSPPTDLKIERVTDITIKLTWEEPQPTVGPIIQYLVIWTNVVNGSSEVGKTSDMYYTIEQLEPYTEYSIRVSARTDSGIGNSSLPVVRRTVSGVPRAPQNLERVKVSNHSIEVKWEEPRPFRGPILSYIVQWGIGGQNWTDIVDHLQHVISGLNPYLTYSIAVRAKTVAGLGNWSTALEIQTAIGIPTSPRNVSEKDKSAVYMKLTWLEPDPANGPLIGYKVMWGVLEEPQYSIQLKNTSYEFQELLPYTEYSFQVTAETDAGWGSPSPLFVARTNIAVPSSANIVSITAHDASKIIVEWETPSPYPGPTTYELFVWKWPGLCSPSDSNSIERVLEGNKSREYWPQSRLDSVDRLPAYTRFSIQIVLKTDAGTQKSEESSLVQTHSKAPGPPALVDADCENKSTEVKVRWKRPNQPNAKITEYIVEYGTEYLGYREVSVQVEDECKDQEVMIRNLRPEREYEIFVRAIAGGRDGDRASLDELCILPAGVPPLGNHQKVHVESDGPFHLTLEWNEVVFSDIMGSLIQYSVIVGVSGAVDKAKSGKVPDEIPYWANFSSGMSDFYQATPRDWNPFNKTANSKDPLHCEAFLESSRYSTLRCTLGLENDCSSIGMDRFCNGPLRPDTSYGVKLRAFTRGGYSETSPLFARTDPIPRSNLAAVLVGVFFILLVVGSLFLGAFVIRKKGGLQQVRKIVESRFRQQHATSDTEPPSVELQPHKNAKCVKVHNFCEHVRHMLSDSHLRFSEEFEALQHNSPKFHCESAQMEENRQKNRWMNIFPYDHSRVKLLPLGDEPASDFINANYIPGDSSLREYIASQGPLPHTVDDFWRMVWEQSTTMIVMLTQCVERGKVKCEQYWPPAAEARHYGDVQVRTLSESMLSSYTIRLFHVQLGSQERRIKQMHFTHWPDFGCPEKPEDLLNFIKAVRDHLPRIRPGPIVVHCSAGVGRTGTFITVDRLMQQLQHSDCIDIYGIVMELRQHRTNMVQTEDQYVYIHMCVQQLIWEMDQHSNTECEEAIYSNLAEVKDTSM